MSDKNEDSEGFDLSYLLWLIIVFIFQTIISIFWYYSISFYTLFWYVTIDIVVILSAIHNNTLIALFFDGGQEREKNKDKDKFPRHYFLNSLTCRCSQCEEWRRGKKQSVKIKTIFFIFLIISLILISLLPNIIPNYSYRSYQKIERIRKIIRDVKYDLVRIVKKESIVNDCETDFYEINLDLPSYKDTVLFDEGFYTIKENDKRFDVPFTQFMDNVFRTINENVNCQIYVQGNADSLGNEKSGIKVLDKNYGFREIEYYPRKGKYYIPNIASINIPTIYSNKHLPFLRGKFIQQKINKIYPEIKNSPIILQGEVTKKVSEKDRNTILYMCVNWNDKNYLEFSNCCVILILVCAFFVIKIKSKIEINFILFKL